MLRAAVLLDRDGVIVEPVDDPRSGKPESPYAPEDVSLIGGGTAALARLQAAGFALAVVSNQPSAAKGTSTLAELQAVHRRVVELLADDGVSIETWEYCFHHPDGVVPELATGCDCRKPAAAMLVRALATLGAEARQSWIVGDSDSDVAAGERAGMRTVLVEHPGSQHRRRGSVSPVLRSASLEAAVAEITRA